MKQTDLDLIANFLENYHLLYKTNLFVNEEHIGQLMKELPEIEIPMPIDKKKIQPAVQKHTVKKNPDAPLWKFERQIENCTKCSLGSTRTKFVFGDGNPDADILFIGEAPGAEEDRTGIPFVGRAGKLLDKLLAGVKIRREEVFIANILKCRPPNNRDPLPAEVAECFPYLNKQIELIKPKIIVALGRISGQRLLETTSSLKLMRGRLWQYRNIDLLVTYHPAALLRTAGWLKAAQEDFKYLAEIYQGKMKYQK